MCCNISKKNAIILYYWASHPVRKRRDIFENPIINFLRPIVTIFIGDFWRNVFEIITIHFTNVIVTTLLKKVPIKECNHNTEATIKITAQLFS